MQAISRIQHEQQPQRDSTDPPMPMPAIETSDAHFPMVMYASVAAVYPGVR
jgi:hypothetical protein